MQYKLLGDRMDASLAESADPAETRQPRTDSSFRFRVNHVKVNQPYCLLPGHDSRPADNSSRIDPCRTMHLHAGKRLLLHFEGDMRFRLCRILLVFTMLSGCLAFAQTATTADQLARLQAQVAQAQSSADNCWMLVSAALVLLMTGPRLALFYGGLLRKKKGLATMLQSFAMMSLVTILWGVFGYSLAFGSGSGFIGGLEFAFLRGVDGTP